MSNTNTGGPAFPMTGMDFRNGQQVEAVHQRGMTLRQYAAIKLKVPDSGTYWLDDMIRKSQRDDFAAKALQGFIGTETEGGMLYDRVAEVAYMYADAMLKARNT